MPVSMLLNPFRKAAACAANLAPFSPAAAQGVQAFHASFSQYAPTPLVSLPGLSATLGLEQVCVKDESRRFGLNAFKVLGGSYAVGRCLAERLGLPAAGLTRALLQNAPASARKNSTFITATDGNHGRGLAWTARELGYACIVRMPRGSNETRLRNILALGAQCAVTDENYDDTVRQCRDLAQKNGYILVQDTAWQGYERIPLWIMQGYTTLAAELLAQLRAARVRPTHCFLQAGVGSFAAAVAAFLAASMGGDAPKFIIVEPHAANCFYRSALAGDGEPHAVGGDLNTLMAGLACGEPSTLAWNILKECAAAFLSCPDYLAATGMRMLAAPVSGDAPVVSGESGAAGAGALHWLMSPAAAAQREALGLGPRSTALLISTEGDTVPEIYKKIVWEGACAAPDLANFLR